MAEKNKQATSGKELPCGGNKLTKYQSTRNF